MPIRSLLMFAVLTLSYPAAAAFASASTDCTSLDDCIDRIAELGRATDAKRQLSPQHRASIDAVLSFGEAAVSPLVALLSDPNEGVANLAAAALRDAPRIDPSHLPAVRAGLDRKLGWLAPALGRHRGELSNRALQSGGRVGRFAPSRVRR